MRKQAEFELYKRLKLLGEGSFGKAYLVECLQDKSLWVTKYMDLGAMTIQEREETLREAKILEFLKHPNIVRFKEVYRTKKGRLCIVMEYADGGDLAKKVKEANGKYLPENLILDWFTQICLAIKHVHDRKIIHRDLKCQNIFLTKTGQVKLGDFGIARILKKTVEKAKTMVGTPYYISPEIIEGKPYTLMTDIWSLGVILYELCALQPPFRAESLHFLALNIVKGQYKQIPNHYSKEIRQLITQLLQVDYRRRPTIQDILKMPVIINRIKSFLSETIQKQEFSHTILHNRNFEIKGNLDQVNLIINEKPCPPSLLEQNQKNLQEFPEIIKKPQPQLSDPSIIRPPQFLKQPTSRQQEPTSRQQEPTSRQQEPTSRQQEPTSRQQEPPSFRQIQEVSKVTEQQPKPLPQEVPKQVEIPKRLEPIIKHSPVNQKKDSQKEILIEDKKQTPLLQQQYPSARPKNNQDKAQLKSEPSKIDYLPQKQHSNSEQDISEQKAEQFISPQFQQKPVEQPRPPTAPKDKNPPPTSQRPQSSKPQVVDQKKPQKLIVDKKRPNSVDKSSPAKYQEEQGQGLINQQRQEERIRQFKIKQQQQQEKIQMEGREKERQLLEKQRMIEKQLQEKQRMQKEKQYEINPIQNYQKIDQHYYEKSPQFGGKQQKDSRVQIKIKQEINQLNKDIDQDLMLQELQGLIGVDNNQGNKICNYIGKENFQDYNAIPVTQIEDREDDEDDSCDKNVKKQNQVFKPISEVEEECLELLNKQDSNKCSTILIKIEKSLGQAKMKNAIDVLRKALDKIGLENIEKYYGPNYEKLLPFLSQEERKKCAPLILTHIIAGS